MFRNSVPLLIFPFALYNIIVFFMPGFSWNGEVWRVYMISGGEWAITPGDAIVAGSVFILLIDMLRSARHSGRRTILDHVLSMVLFVVMLIEFMAIKAVVSSTFFLLLVISFVDVAGGFAVSIRAAVARRDVLMSETGGGGAGA
ncbi:MAG: hypothetical protein FWD12_13795 [Alphaproteobacteria bacterium]|nr:hypothetical protein [Alphaproteobacteria bacterium]